MTKMQDAYGHGVEGKMDTKCYCLIRNDYGHD